MKTKKVKKIVKGQALLPLLIVIVIVLSLGAAAIELAISSLIVSRISFEGQTLFYTTEAAFENGLLRALRNPSYVGESLQINQASCTIEASGQAPKTILAICSSDRQVKKIQGQIDYINGVMTVTDIVEVE